jgi:hypothetical protein
MTLTLTMGNGVAAVAMAVAIRYIARAVITKTQLNPNL